MYRLTRIPGILNLLLIAIAISLTGCGSGSGGGGSASTPPVIQPPIIQNPLNGVWTFANGVQIDTNPDSDNPLLTRCQRLDKTIWQFPISNYKLVDQTQTDREVQFSFGSVRTDSLFINVMGLSLGYPRSEMGQWGASDTYHLVAGMDGGIYCMKMRTGTGYGDFEIASINDSPRMFLPPTLSLNTVWVGGIRCQSTMITENTFEVSPSLVNGCYRFHQTLTDPFNQNYISVQWYFLRGSGFVDRVNTVTHQWCTRTPAANG